MFTFISHHGKTSLTTSKYHLLVIKLFSYGNSRLMVLPFESRQSLNCFDESNNPEVTLHTFQGSDLKSPAASSPCLLKYTLLGPWAIITPTEEPETGPETAWGERGTQLNSSFPKSWLSYQGAKWSHIEPTRIAHLSTVNLKTEYKW